MEVDAADGECLRTLGSGAGLPAFLHELTQPFRLDFLDGPCVVADGAGDGDGGVRCGELDAAESVGASADDPCFLWCIDGLENAFFESGECLPVEFRVGESWEVVGFGASDECVLDAGECGFLVAVFEPSCEFACGGVEDVDEVEHFESDGCWWGWQVGSCWLVSSWVDGGVEACFQWFGECGESEDEECEGEFACGAERVLVFYWLVAVLAVHWYQTFLNSLISDGVTVTFARMSLAVCGLAGGLNGVMLMG